MPYMAMVFVPAPISGSASLFSNKSIAFLPNAVEPGSVGECFAVAANVRGLEVNNEDDADAR